MTRASASAAPRNASAEDHAVVRTERFARIRPGAGDAPRETRTIPVEAPVAVEFNGIAYAVMMATPADLEDFVTGFAIAERLLPAGASLRDVTVHHVDAGVIVRARLPAEAAEAIFDRARARVAESSCGLCGIESLEALSRPLPPVAAPLAPGPDAIFAALAALPAHQHIGRTTSATHAAALCEPGGQIVLVREDVGRHNALDKAIGAHARAGGVGPLFALSTARCSYELVEKATIAGLRALVTVSAATSLAVDRARAAGLPLYVLARADGVLRIA